VSRQKLADEVDLESDISKGPRVSPPSNSETFVPPADSDPCAGKQDLVWGNHQKGLLKRGEPTYRRSRSFWG